LRGGSRVTGRRSEGFAALVDSIYEAAFWPENWNGVLGDVGAASGSAAGLLMVFDGARPVGFRATPIIHDVIEAAAASRDGPNPRAAFALKNPFRGFVVANDYLPPEILNSDRGHARRLAIGLDSEASSVTIMPTGELVVFSFDRWRREGPHRKQHLATLNALYPHLARTALVAARLGLERAGAATTALQMIGLPAAVLTGSGRVLSSNSAFGPLSAQRLRPLGDRRFPRPSPVSGGARSRLEDDPVHSRGRSGGAAGLRPAYAAAAAKRA
jgi:hypothetical protein